MSPQQAIAHYRVTCKLAEGGTLPRTTQPASDPMHLVVHWEQVAATQEFALDWSTASLSTSGRVAGVTGRVLASLNGHRSSGRQ